VRDAADEHSTSQRVASHEDAIHLLLAARGGAQRAFAIDAIGHRLVHGGRTYSQPQLVTAAMLQVLRDLVPLAPTHLPTELAAIPLLGREYPQAPQVACFDTAFHRTMPMTAQLLGLPRGYFEEGILRYGFHGLSYEYLLLELARRAGAEAAA